MTKAEFIKYLDGFNKDSGEFTEDELYEIGCKFKNELPLSEKDWSWLVEKLGPVNAKGESKSGETFRLWIKSRQYQKGEIKKNEQLLSGQTINDLTFEEFEDKTEEIKQDLYKQQVKTRDHMNAYRALLREDARIDLMKDLIRDSVKPLAPLDCDFVSCYETEEGVEAVLLLSDLHIGAEINNFYNVYNIEVARRRVRKVVVDTIETCKRLHVAKLNIVNLGDNVHGQIHTSARLLQEVDVIDQVTIASEILAESIAELAKNIPLVVYRSCLDNHSRTTANLKESIENENFGRLIDWYLESRLVSTNIVFAKDNLDMNIGMFTLENGKKLVFAHGHQDNINQVTQGYTAATRQHIDYVCLGHYHSTKMKTFLNTKVIVNGSVVGTEDYAMSHRLFGTPEQTLLIFAGDNLINVTIGLGEIK